MRRKLFVGNWKMNGSLSANHELLTGIKAGFAAARGDLAICVPTPYLAQCRELLGDTGIALGAQDVSAHTVGPYTGEVSTRMLRDFDCRYVIVGHSERREYHKEDDYLVSSKVHRALAGGITPILCVGETLTERRAGKTNDVINRQLHAVLSDLEPEEVSRIIVAYEPVWAIGTGRTATPEIAQEVHAMLREMLIARNPMVGERVKILYGGSMRPANARELLQMPDIDGGLIGGESLKSKGFLEIASAV